MIAHDGKHSMTVRGGDGMIAQARRIPGSTYRLQMHAGFNLTDATAIIPYLKSLGITHAYLSSLLTAKKGSTHGYDVSDHTRLNPEIGTMEQFREFSRQLKQQGMGILLDVVPNHMSVGSENAWWSDVMENGPSSPYAGYFDIAWNDHPRDYLKGKVLLPILGKPYGDAIDDQLFRLAFAGGGFLLLIYETELSIDPRTYGLILEPVLESLKDRPESEEVLEFQSILNAIRHLPKRTESDQARIDEGRGEIAVIKRRLRDLTSKHEELKQAIETRLEELAKDPVQLDRLIEAQAYRPCSWRVASDEINYRRFFDVNDLAALSTEKAEVFRDVHRLIFEWLEEGLVDGLRIDHPDGLFDPKTYLNRLREQAHRPDGPLYVVVEKILGPREELRSDWAADGTTGYEFINAVNGLFVDGAAEAPLSDFFESFSGRDESFEDLVYHGKFLILQSSMTSELHILAGHLDRLAQSDRTSRDFTLNGLRHVLREVLCCFPVYRTYIDGQVSDIDRIVIREAVRKARRRNPTLGKALFDFLRDTLLLKDPKSGPATEEYRAAQITFAGKFQQLSAPVMAKGFEDTALYVYNRLTSLNEVGGDPSRFGRKPEEIHAFFASRKPGGLSPLSTHDTKRSEDVRARINVLSEMPKLWTERVELWSQWNRLHRVEVDDGVLAPDGNEEHLIYQTLAGTWPLEKDWDRREYAARIGTFLVKALHEAKVNSSWINPDSDYDKAIVEFIERILDPVLARDFLNDFEQVQTTIQKFGLLNSLAQTLVRSTAPGVPDIYWGTDLWDFSLVDPDNRRLPDFAKRAELLKSLDGERSAGALLERKEDGRAKLLVISRALRLRREQPDLFEKGDYHAVAAAGPRADHLFAFLRTWKDQAVLTVAPRLLASLAIEGDMPAPAELWKDTVLELPNELNGAQWRNLLTGQTVKGDNGSVGAAHILADFPVGLLVRE